MDGRIGFNGTLLALLVFPALAFSQISWSGIYDFEIQKGGSGSKLELNQLPNSYLQFNVQNLQLFVDATVDDGISLSTKIATNRQTPLDPRILDLFLDQLPQIHAIRKKIRE